MDTAILLYGVTAAVYFAHCCGYRKCYDQETPGFPAPYRRAGHFNYHSPRGSDRCPELWSCFHTHFNPRSPWGERPLEQMTKRDKSGISIHAPRGGERLRLRPPGLLPVYISIHAPRGGSDKGIRAPRYLDVAFQSTLPVGGATPPTRIFIGLTKFQSTLPVGGATPRDSAAAPSFPNFNPRSPWGERRFQPLVLLHQFLFQSTLPVGGATLRSAGSLPDSRISIHAPRGGSDFPGLVIIFVRPHFNPRSPWGERLVYRLYTQTHHRFQSTLPVGGATRFDLPQAARLQFQSTLPVGGATLDLLCPIVDYAISIHAPRGGSDHHI